MDPKHPFRIGEEFYQTTKEGVRHSGTCTLALQVEPDGSTYAMQLLISAGFPELDAACIKAVNNVKLLPGTINGRPTRAWFVFKIDWKAEWTTPSRNQNSPHAPFKLEDFAGPHIRADYVLHVGPNFYPHSARENNESGFCMVNVLIDHTGNALDTRLSKPTGFPDLDLSCLNSISRAEFAPMAENAKKAWATVVIFWRPD